MKEFAYEAFAVALDITFWVVASRGGEGEGRWMGGEGQGGGGGCCWWGDCFG